MSQPIQRPMTRPTEIQIPNLVILMARARWHALAVVILAALLGLAAPTLAPPLYQATSTLRIGHEAELNLRTLPNFVQIKTLMDEVAQTASSLPSSAGIPELVSAELERQVSIEMPHNKVLVLTIKNRDPAVAETIARLTATLLAEKLQQTVSAELAPHPSMIEQLNLAKSSLESFIQSPWFKNSTSSINPQARASISELAKSIAQLKQLSSNLILSNRASRGIVLSRPSLSPTLLNQFTRVAEALRIPTHPHDLWLLSQVLSEEIRLAEEYLRSGSAQRAQEAFVFDPKSVVVSTAYAPRPIIIFLMAVAAGMIALLAYQIWQSSRARDISNQARPND